MNTINQTNDNLKRIQAKATLGLSLTDRESALLTLYAERREDAGNVNTSKKV